MGDMRRRLVFPVAVLVGCTWLGGCYMGPDPVQYGALAVIDGKATAVVALCGRSTTHLSVYQDDNDPVYRSWSVAVTVSAPVPDVEVELLGAERPGWQITSSRVTGAQRGPLTSFEPGTHYVLNASRGGPEGTSAPTVSFTTDDLARIGDGQVLAPIDYKKTDVVSREAFVQEACAKKGPGADR